MGQKLLGVTAGCHRFGVGIKKHTAVTDENARQLVGHHYRGLEPVAQLVEQPGADRMSTLREFSLACTKRKHFQRNAAVPFRNSEERRPVPYTRRSYSLLSIPRVTEAVMKSVCG